MKKTEALHKYDVKFTVRPQNSKVTMTKEKRNMLKK